MLGLGEAPRVLLQPSFDGIASILQQCWLQRERAPALRLHAYLRKSGLEAHASAATLLVSMLVDVGGMLEAQYAFDRLVYRDEGSWGALISGYILCEKPLQALALFRSMLQDRHVCPSSHTFVALLKACAKLHAMEHALEMHAVAEAYGLPQTDLFVGSALVDMLAKSGSLARAQQVFAKLHSRNAVTWNALINAYMEKDCCEQAQKLLEQMRLEGIVPTAATYVLSLKACGYLNDREKGQDLHSEAERKGLLQSDVYVGSSLVDMYVKCGLVMNAQEVFDALPIRNVVVWTTLLTGYVDCCDGEEALNCFKLMEFEGVSSNAVTVTCCLKACGSIGAIEMGLEIHAEVERRGFLENNLVIGNALVDMYAKCGLLVIAREVFDNLPVQNIVSWTTLISGLTEHDYAEEALQCFQQMKREKSDTNAVVLICCLKACGTVGALNQGQEIHMEIVTKGLLEADSALGSTLVDMYAKGGCLAEAQSVSESLTVRDVVSWNALIGGYAEHFKGQKAVDGYEKMQLEGISPSGVTFLCVLKACGSMGAVDKGREIHSEIERQGLLGRDFVVGNTLVDMYAKCGLLAIAHQVFDELPFRDIVSCNSLIAGYVQVGESEHAFHTFDRSLQEGLKPDLVTFLLLLNTCTRSCLSDKTATLFEAMTRGLGFVPAIEHHTCLIDLLARSGQLEKAIAIMKNMPVRTNLMAWLALLSACRSTGNLDMATKAFEHAWGGEGSREVSPYSLMSEVHACTSWERSVKVG